MLTWSQRFGFYQTSLPKKIYHLFLRQLAKFWLNLHPKVCVIGVVGSYGKTTTAQMLARTLETFAPTVVTDINLDTLFNLPITILRLQSHHRFLILEMGVDHEKEMDFHLELVTPNVLIFTGVTPVHAQKGLLNSLATIIREKGKAALAVSQKKGIVIANADSLLVKKYIQRKKLSSVIWFGKKDPLVSFKIEKVKISLKGTSFGLREKGRRPVNLFVPALGESFAFSAAAIAATLSSLDLPWQKNLAKIIKIFRPLSGRMSLERGPAGSLLINDSLRASPASIKAGLEVLSELKVNASTRKIAVLGEMGELGIYAKKEHRKVGRMINNLDIDLILGIGPLLSETGKSITKKKFILAKDIIEAIAKIKKIHINSQDIIYLKGSRLKHLERLILALKRKKVNCRQITCHYYWDCSHCPQLTK